MYRRLNSRNETMHDFFKVTDLNKVLELVPTIARTGPETVALSEADGRILAEEILADTDVPAFSRSTMDGYAVQAVSTFGASEGNPAYLTIQGQVSMGETPLFSIASGQAARIATGGMLPAGADSVIMVEHTEPIDEETFEAYRSVAPGQHVVTAGEDVRSGETVLHCGQSLRPQELGVLAALGRVKVRVFRQPVVGIISTGDEIVPVDARPAKGQVRDMNTYTLAGLVRAAGALPRLLGIVGDDYGALFGTCAKALAECDMVMISGGSSVGARDFTIDVLSALPQSQILVHGISISPGKPTILARVGDKLFWGLPGHVTSAMVVFAAVVEPFVAHLGGLSVEYRRRSTIPACLSRNVSSAQGRVDYIRVQLQETDGVLYAHPILGKSGLIYTMVKADGLLAIDINTEGLDRGSPVDIMVL